MIEHKTLNVVSVATNNYLEYWKEQAKSIEEHLAPNFKCKLFVFTDQPEEATKFSSEFIRLQVQVTQIPSYRWPEATLRRYQLITSLRGTLKDDDILMYLDSDMLAVSELSAFDFCSNNEIKVTLVQHPGFFRLRGWAGLKFYSTNPKIAIQDLLNLFVSGGVGAWETRPSSNAFVSRKMRRRYYCGGIWWGSALGMIELSEQLAERIDEDSSKGIVAIWHDESHLNWWATMHAHDIASPAYCFSPDFPALKQLRPKIQAVDKGDVSRD